MKSSLWSRVLTATGLLIATVGVITPVGVVNAQPARADANPPPTLAAGDVVPGEYVVMLRPDGDGEVRGDGVGATDLSQRIDAVMSRLDDSIGANRNDVSSSANPAEDPVIAELAVIDGFAVELSAAEAAVLSNDEDVVSVEPNIAIEPSVVPDVAPTAGPSELPWGLDRIDQPDLPLDGTFTAPNDGAGVTAYVIDGGVWDGHQELAGRVKPMVDFMGDYPSIDKIERRCLGHGTHVAGTIAGTNVGVAPAATIQPVRVLGCRGGYLIGVLRGMDWVAKNAQLPAVANMSLGGIHSPSLDSAAAYLASIGITVTVSAGNSAQEACSYSPASEPSVITVGATTKKDKIAYFSNFGPCLDLLAPGVDVVSAGYAAADQYRSLDGTSMASPHVAGVAAVYLSQHPDASPAAVERALIAGSAADVVANLSPDSPNRMLQINDLPDPIEDPATLPVAHIAPPAGVGPVGLGKELTFDGSRSFDPLGGALTYQWRVQGRSGVVGTDPTLTTVVDSGVSFVVFLTVTNAAGVSTTTSIMLDVTDLNPPIVVLDPPQKTIVAEAGSELSWDASGSYDPDGDDVSIVWEYVSWDREEPVTGTGPNITVTVGSQFGYVDVFVVNEWGAYSFKTVDIYPSDGPQAFIEPDLPFVPVGDTVTFDGTASLGASLTYEWRDSGVSGGGVVSTDETYTRTFDEVGAVEIQLTVTTPTGNSNTATASFDVVRPPAAKITPTSVDVKVGEPVTFDARGTTGGGDSPLSFDWRVSGKSGVVSNEDTYTHTFNKVGEYTVELTATDFNQLSDTATATVNVSDVPPPPPDPVPAMVSVDPVRVLDTRTSHPDAPGPKGTVGAGEMVKFTVAGVPSSASGVMLNVTAVAPRGDGHVTVYPCGDRPNTSNLNYYQGVTRGNSVMAMLTDGHELCVWTKAAADIVVDMTGYVRTDSAVHSMKPVRAFDTRKAGANNAAPTAVKAGGVVEVPVTSMKQVPDDATAVFVNLAVASPSADGHLTAYPCGDLPPTSSLNYRSGVTLSSSAVVALSDDGTMCVRSHAKTDVIIDVLGYVDAGGSMNLLSERKFDTRAKYPKTAPKAKGAIAAGKTVKVKLGVDPAKTAGVLLTVTAVAPQGDGHLTVFPCGELPTTSGLNYASGVTTSNMVFAKVDDTGSVCVRTHATTDLVVDYTGAVLGAVG